ncbi:MAG TPA: DUF2917 domain-containing protein [Burkholderiaceae bacterium]|nr:DUF2917 domain-containing protein [Burkholderiaceae bacterium]
MKSPALFDLASRVVLPLDRSSRMTVRVLRGRVWITEEGNPRDVIISAGHSHRIGTNGLVLVEGITTARVLIEEHVPAKAPVIDVRSWWTAMRLKLASRRKSFGATSGAA